MVNYDNAQNSERRDNIQKLVEAGKYYGNVVAKQLNQEYEAAMESNNSLNFIKLDEQNWIAEDGDRKFTVQFFLDPETKASCECGNFTSWKLPCRHMVFPIMSSKALNFSFKSEALIPGRWLLKNHSSYNQAITAVARPDPELLAEQVLLNEAKRILSVKVPKKADVRFKKLTVIMSRIASAASNDIEWYKKAYIYFLGFEKKIKGKKSKMPAIPPNVGPRKKGSETAQLHLARKRSAGT